MKPQYVFLKAEYVLQVMAIETSCCYEGVDFIRTSGRKQRDRFHTSCWWTLL